MFLNKIKKGIDDHGVMIYFVYVLKRLLHSVTTKASIQFVYLYSVPVEFDRKIKLPAFMKKNFKILLLQQDNEMLHCLPLSQKTIDYRFKQNAVCLLILKKGKPIGYFWLILKLYQEDIMYLDIHLKAESAWDFDLWVHEDYRLSSAFMLLWEAALEYFAERGVKSIYSRISTTNNNSVQVHSKLGGRIISKLLFFRVGAIEFLLDFGKRRMSIHTPLRRKKLLL